MQPEPQLTGQWVGNLVLAFFILGIPVGFMASMASLLVTNLMLSLTTRTQWSIGLPVGLVVGIAVTIALARHAMREYGGPPDRFHRPVGGDSGSSIYYASEGGDTGDSGDGSD